MGRARGKRSNDTGYRVFHKDSMKIARDFITGEMSVNKNEYSEGESGRASIFLSLPTTSSLSSLLDSSALNSLWQPIRKCDLAPTA